MARNTKKEYLLKLLKMEKNGYKFDIANYLHNPSYDHDYPSFRKTIAEDDETMTVNEIMYFKHWNGEGEYTSVTSTYTKAEAVGSWNIAHKVERKVLGTGNRFNLNTLLSYC